MKLIEMVCTGNLGRSPLAELVAQEHLAANGLADRIQVVSSGVAVDAIHRGEYSPSMVFHVVQLALDRGLYRTMPGNDIPDDTASVEAALAARDTAALGDAFRFALESFTDEEVLFRGEAIRFFGIRGRVKAEQTQTVARPDVVAVFGMGAKHVAGIRSAYHGTREQGPLIDLLGAYATGRPNFEITNPYGLGPASYSRAAAQIVATVPLAINRLLEEGRV